MKHLKEITEWLVEDTSGGGGYTGPVAFASLAITAGMGAPVASQPSSIPGDVAGATVGSGDIGSGWSKAKTLNSLRNDFQTKHRKRTDADLFGTSKRRNAKLTRGLKQQKKDGLFQMNSPKKAKGNIKSFSAFTKNESAYEATQMSAKIINDYLKKGEVEKATKYYQELDFNFYASQYVEYPLIFIDPKIMKIKNIAINFGKDLSTAEALQAHYDVCRELLKDMQGYENYRINFKKETYYYELKKYFSKQSL